MRAVGDGPSCPPSVERRGGPPCPPASVPGPEVVGREMMDRREPMKDRRSSFRQRWQRRRTRLIDALRREGRVLWEALLDPLMLGLVVVSLILVPLAYLFTPTFTLDVGQQPDDAYIAGFHAEEQSAGRTFRWSTAEGRVRIPGLGQAPQRVNLVMAAPRPLDCAPPHLRLEAGGQLLLDTAVGPQLQTYTVVVPGESLPRGDLDLLLHTDTFTTAQDPRVLGIVLDRLETTPIGWPAEAPPLPYLLTGLSVALAIVLARRLGWAQRPTLVAGSILALALAAGLAGARPLLTPALPFLPLGLLVAWAIVALAQRAVGQLFRRAGAPLSPRAERALWSVLAVFLVVRLAGVLHPALETWDLCFHWHHLEAVSRGQVLFTIVSGEWRSQETFYLPTLYVLQAPLWGLFGGRLVPFKIVGVLLDTGSALLVAYIARRLLGGGNIVPLAAFLYLTMPQSYIIFSWGIVANILGQGLLLLVVAFLLSPAGRLARRRDQLLAGGLLLPTLLAHPGSVLLAGALLAGLLATVWLAPIPPVLPRRTAWRWAGAGLAAVLLAVLLYYSYFAGTMWQSIQAMRAGANAEQPAQGGILVRGPVIDPDLGLVPVEVETTRAALRAGVQELAAEARAYYHTWPLVLALGAVIGWAIDRRPRAARLGGLALAVALLFAIVGLALNLYVRYMYFLLPIVALGGAWWLVRLCRHRWAGKAVATVAGLYLAGAGLWFWIDHVLYYSAGCR